MRVTYFGWSGIAVSHAGAGVAFDPFGEDVRWEALGSGPVVVCATHGHPEHCGALRSLLEEGNRVRRSPVHLVSSAPVTHWVAWGTDLPADRLHAVEEGESVRLDGAEITAFRWRHMPLLPPGAGAKLGYLARLLGHPIELVRIAASAAPLPAHAPTLGYRVTFPDGRTLLNYSEGLHRLTDPEEVSRVANELPGQVLLFAVEPEDARAVPRWVERLAPSTVLLYEAHRPWRELFGLPYLDLDRYAEELEARLPSAAAIPLTRPGQTVSV